PHYREGQRETIDSVREAFAAGKRFVVVEAPTGSGQSAIAVTLAREAASAFVLTAQKVLQDQYVRDFSDLAIMKGRSNYPCLIAPTHAAAAPCIVGRRLPACDECPYFTAKDVAMAANVTTMNYAYFLAELNYAGGFGHRDLLVLDEAHNTEAALMGFVQVNIGEAQLVRAGIARALPPDLGPETAFDFVDDLLPELQARARTIDAELKADATSEADVQRLRVKQWLESAHTRIRVLLDSHASGEIDWVVERHRNETGPQLTFKPVEVSGFAEELIYAHADRVLMLSATILDGPTFLRSLGIDEDEAEIIQVGSTFPASRRPVVLRPSARLTRRYVERDLPLLNEAISELAADHAGDKGVVHAHSYRIATYLAKNLASSQRHRVVTHFDAAGREDALNLHLHSSEPTILITPSMTEGIDLADDLARWQVLCKVPYPFLGDPQVAARMERDREWYDWRTCLAIVQAYGRSVRSAEDHAVTYLLDADFPAFIRRQGDRLPEWFLEAVDESW
ncbi:MAG TPA: helicase C-terminal domain-containing protein, partial [Trueperaceae bacterium]|nr:helicase C-terminal domain-containing protein [Trueperaceae bacterium]